jgi:U2 small nuclear ribonucleoprotein B''
MEDPNQTLYINNLNDKVNKFELKRLLYHLLCTYGQILEIRNSKSKVLRGQAFVVFEEVRSAVNAKRDLNGMSLLGKQMRIDFARTKSHVIDKKAGIFTASRRPKQQNGQ